MELMEHRGVDVAASACSSSMVKESDQLLPLQSGPCVYSLGFFLD